MNMIIRKKKQRKHRTTGYDLCSCGYQNCDPFNWKTISGLKIHKRLREGKCMGCGKIKDECSCKSSL